MIAAVALLALPVVILVVDNERAVDILGSLLQSLPSPIRQKIMDPAREFADAVHALGRPPVLLLSAVLSLLIWAITIYVAWALMGAFSFDDLGVIDAAAVTLFVAVALLMPAPVGGLGVFEAGAVVGLGVCGIDEDPAAIYALTLHAVHLGTITILGLVCLTWEGIGWRELRNVP